MKKSRHKINSGVKGNTEEPLHEKEMVERPGLNLFESKKHDFQTADKILLYIQEVEKF